jgi:hypothetical protein
MKANLCLKLEMLIIYIMTSSSLWGRTDLEQPVRSSHTEETKLTDCIQTNSNHLYECAQVRG